MTLTRFVTKNAFRNKRRSILTVLSIALSLLLLTLMMTMWRAFYLDQGSAESAERLVVRHRVSLTFALPGFYREKIRAIPGVVAVVPSSWFQGVYKDQKPENFFAHFGTDPDEFFKVFRDMKMPEDQITAWQRDRQGAIVDDTLAKKYGWKLGDRIHIAGRHLSRQSRLDRARHLSFNPRQQIGLLQREVCGGSGAVLQGPGGHFQCSGRLARGREQGGRRRSTTCSATRRNPPRRRAKKPSAWSSWP